MSPLANPDITIAGVSDFASGLSQTYVSAVGEQRALSETWVDLVNPHAQCISDEKETGMSRHFKATAVLALVICPAVPATAADIDSLRGQFTFDWHTEPDQQTCAAVDDKLLSRFKSAAFTCNLDVITNTASDEPARVCTDKAGGAEYMIFETKESCEHERTTQASNSEE